MGARVDEVYRFYHVPASNTAYGLMVFEDGAVRAPRGSARLERSASMTGAAANGGPAALRRPSRDGDDAKIGEPGCGRRSFGRMP